MSFLLKFTFFSSIFLLTTFCFSQGEANRWYFGNNAAIDFSSGVPVAVTNSAMATDEGSSSISDATGNLLFYTDGITVYNKNHVVMANGNGLLGSPSSTQSGVIIQKPGSATNYYVFTTIDVGLPNGLRYSEIDMSGDFGNGIVTANKNILLHSPTCEKITGIRHQNNRDIWLVSHDAVSNMFRTYLITPTGINLNPVLSSAGIILSASPSIDEAGQMKAYLGGKKIATAAYSSGLFELFDFDNATGVISNPIHLTGTNGNAYGVEFSPDGSKLYCSIANGPSINPLDPPTENLYQFDLCAGTGTTTDIINSKQVIMSSVPMLQGLGSMQLALDGKIYVARFNGFLGNDPLNSHYIGVINNPNVAGLACNYVDEGFFLGANSTSSLGLPNFVPYNLNIVPPPILSFSYDSILCDNAITANPILHPNFIPGGDFTCTNPNLAININTGQIDLNQSQIGIYDVKYNFIVSSCGIQSYDTTIQVRIEDGIQHTDFSYADQLCVTGNKALPVLPNNFASGGVFSSSNGLNVNAVTGEIALAGSAIGSYSVNYSKLAVGCKQANFFNATIDLLNSTTASFSPYNDTTLGLFNTQVFFKNHSINTSSYSWNFGDDTTLNIEENPTHTYQPIPGVYLVTLISFQNGLCNDTTYAHIRILDDIVIYVPNTFTPNSDERNQVFKPVISNKIKSGTYKLEIFNRWGQLIFESLDENVGWDGTFNKAIVEEGSYTWNIEFVSSETVKYKKTGHVLMIK